MGKTKKSKTIKFILEKDLINSNTLKLVKLGRHFSIDNYWFIVGRNEDENLIIETYKNAIKSGEKLTQNQMHAIVDQLFACESPYFCPHGRPVVVTIERDELDRKFKR